MGEDSFFAAAAQSTKSAYTSKMADKPRAAKPKAKKGKTIDPKKVNSVETWANYFKKGYQNIVIDEDGSFVVLDPELTKTDFAAALKGTKKAIPHLMGEDYITVLADPKAPSELRAAAEIRRKAIHEVLDARIEAAKAEYEVAESNLIEANTRWRNAPDRPTRTDLAQSVAEANAAVALAEQRLRLAQAPHRYIVGYGDLKRSMLIAGSGDDRPILNTIYRIVPEVTEAPERVISRGVAAYAASNLARGKMWMAAAQMPALQITEEDTA